MTRKSIGIAFLILEIFFTGPGCTPQDAVPSFETGEADYSSPSRLYQSDASDWICEDDLALPDDTVVYHKLFADGGGIIVFASGRLVEFRHRMVNKVLKNLELQQSSYVSSAHFETLQSGWLAVNYLRSVESNSSKKKTQVIHTLDGGQTWSIQFEMDRAEISQIVVSSPEQIWLAGRYSEAGKAYQPRLLLFKTVDAGRSWKEALKDIDVQLDTGANDLTPLDSGELLLLTNRNDVYKISANDVAKPMGRVPDRPQTYYTQAEGSEARVWVLGGTDSREGVWGVLAVRRNDAWTKRILPSIYFSSGIQISEYEYFVSGYRVDDSDVPVEARSRKGVLLYTNDEGRTFHPVCTGKVDSRRGSLIPIDRNSFSFAGGSKHIIVRRLSAN